MIFYLKNIIFEKEGCRRLHYIPGRNCFEDPWAVKQNNLPDMI